MGKRSLGMGKGRFASRAAAAVVGAAASCLAIGTVAGAAIPRRGFPAGFDGGHPVAAGTVASAPSNGTFTITTRSGATLTVDVAATTTYVEHGVSSPSLADVTPGALVAVFGTTSGTTVTATEVNVFVPRAVLPAPVAAGTVASAPSNGTFTITTRSGATLTVDVAATTTYVEHGVSSPSLADVTPGALVAVFGTTSGTTVTATEVAIAPPKPSGTFATAGTVIGTPTATSFTVATCSGTTVTVDVSSSTTYADFGVASPSLGNVTAGEFVSVFGTISGTTVTANEVVIAGSKRHGIFGFGKPFPVGHGYGGFGFGRGFGGLGTTVTAGFDGAVHGAAGDPVRDFGPGHGR